MATEAEKQHEIALLNELYKNRKIDDARGRGIEEMGTAIRRVSGKFNFKGNGEGTKEVTFPVKFTELPSFWFGGELVGGQTIQNGFFPTVSVVVHSWKSLKRPPVTQLYYGATLLIVVTGHTDQRLVVHWHMEGNSLSDPSVDHEDFPTSP